MKLEKKELVALFASLILIVFAAIVFFNHESKTKVSPSLIDNKQEKTQDDAAKIQSLLTSLESAPNDESIANIEELLKKLPDSTKKDDLVKRLDAVKIKLAKEKAEKKAQEDAEKAVKSLEDEQNDEKLSAAQEAVNKVGNENKRSKLQARIDVIREQLEAIAQAAAAAMLQESSDSSSDVQDTTPTYEYSTPNTETQAPTQSQTPNSTPSQTPSPTPTKPTPSDEPATTPQPSSQDPIETPQPSNSDTSTPIDDGTSTATAEEPQE